MCGIAGYCLLNQDTPLPFDWTRMVAALVHRGPDEEGFYQNARVGIGSRRLSIIDLAGGTQPLKNERGDIFAFQNGEIYNYRALRAALETRGHHFKTSSDTETIAHGYEEWGNDVVIHLRAMFAIAVWDDSQKRLLLARDHFGIKPLFYTTIDGVLYFASEIKSLLLHPRLRRELDMRALDQYLSFLYIPAPRTIFKNIFELPPAHRLIIENGSVRVERYWSPHIELQQNEHVDRAQIAAAFEDSVHAQMVSDVPLGAFLSGGIDSAAIVAMMKRHTDQPVKTFTLGFGAAEEHWDETEIASRVAQYYGTEHHAFRIEPNIVELVPQVIAHFDEPFANPTAVLMLLLSRETRKHVTVALAGTGGDELFAGYPRYVGMLAYQQYQHVPQFARQVVANAARTFARDATNGQLRAQRLRRFFEGGALPFDECYLRWLVAIDSSQKRALYASDTQRALQDADIFDFIRPLLDDASLPPSERLLPTDFQTYLPFNQLAYADRMSMAASLEVRVPFVDQTLFESVKNIPLRDKVNGTQTKALFRQALSSALPPFILDAPKTGLNLPIALWFRGALREWLHDLLSPQTIRARGLFDASAIQTILDEHDAGRRDHSLFLWALVMLEVWQRMYLDGVEANSSVMLRASDALPSALSHV